MSTRWVAASIPSTVEALERAGHPQRLAKLLALRGIATADSARAFLAPESEELLAPERLPGFAPAFERLARAASVSERILLVGDYDVDGVTATALMATALRASGAEVETLLPRRDGEGYGLQPLHARRAAEIGATLLVAVDSGTNAREAAEEARRLGVDLVVVDHHLPDANRAEPVLLVNPRLGTRLGPDIASLELTAAGLALKLAAALYERSGRPAPWDALLRVAALGTIADVAPLIGENRTIAARGLSALAQVRSPGLRALMEIAAVRAPVAASDVAFRLAPRLNAAGRLGAADAALELLLTRDEGRARALAAELHALNAERQRIEEALVRDAQSGLAERERGSGKVPAIVVAWREGWHRGVVGIAAARLARESHRPALLLAIDGDLAVGSGRSVEGIALHEFLAPWASRLERFGGHAQAIGLTARVDRLELLRAEWEEAAEGWSARLAERERRYDLALDLAEADEGLLAQVRSLEPIGAGNAEPIFRFGPCRIVGSPREFGRGHLGFVVKDARGEREGARVPVVAWRTREDELALDGELELLAAVERDRPRGVRLRLVDLRPATL